MNDEYDHDADDQVIKTVAETLRTRKRARDIIGRLGNKEVAIILLEGTLDKPSLRRNGSDNWSPTAPLPSLDAPS